LWTDAAAVKLTHVLRGHARAVTALAVSADGRFAFSGSADTTVRQWRLETGHVGANSPARPVRALSEHSSPRVAQIARVFDGHSHAVNAVAVLPDGRHVFSASADKLIHQWSTETGAVRRRWRRRGVCRRPRFLIAAASGVCTARSWWRHFADTLAASLRWRSRPTA
jgi:WD40 repeat protein